MNTNRKPFHDLLQAFGGRKSVCWFWMQPVDHFISHPRTNISVPAWAKGLIRYFSIFHDRILGLNLHFRKPEKLLEEEDTSVQAHARQQILTLPGNVQISGCSVKKNQVPRLTREATKSPIILINCCPTCLSFARCPLYSYHLSLGIGKLPRLVGIKQCVLGTRVLGVGWVGPCPRLEPGLEHSCSNPHHIIIWACHSGPETRTLHYTTQVSVSMNADPINMNKQVNYNNNNNNNLYCLECRACGSYKRM